MGDRAAENGVRGSADAAACDIWRFFAHEDDYADLNAQTACERMGRVLSFPTLSSMDNDVVDWRPFDELRRYMAEAWPRVFTAGTVELIDRSLLITLPGSDPALKPIMFMGHMDVVPVVPGTEDDWTHDAFSGHVDDTFVWGRGAVDMKCQVAGELEAAEYALAHGWRLRRTLILAFGQDEETNQFGARAVADALRRRGVELEFLVDEGDYRIVPGSEYGLEGGWLMHADLAEKGYADVVLRVQSPGGHSSNPFGGTSLEKLARAITAICNIDWNARLTPLTVATLTELGLASAEDIAERTDKILARCLADMRLMPLVTTTCAPTQIEGGSSGANVMPQDMWANVNFRMLEGTSIDDVLGACRAALDAAGLAEVSMELGPGSSEASPSPRVGGPGLEALRRVAARYFREPAGERRQVDVLASAAVEPAEAATFVSSAAAESGDACAESAHTETSPAPTPVAKAADRVPVRVVPSTVTGATDAANYACICPECLRFSAFVVTDDECDRGVHGTNERITRRAYLQGVRFMTRLIEETCV